MLISSSFLSLLVLNAFLKSILSRCPNNCYGRGKCNTENICICDANYVVEGAPDCSQSIYLFKIW